MHQITIYIKKNKQYLGKKFLYEYQFVNEQNEIRLRGLEVWYKDEANNLFTVLCLYPGFKLDPIDIEINLPPDIKFVTKRKHIILNQKILGEVQKLTTLPVVTKLTHI